MRQQLIDKFLEIFGEGDDANVYFAPGRINLIGEHTDYNGGHVFPCAITIGTYAAARRRKDQELHLYSLNYPENGMIQAPLSDLYKQKLQGFLRTGYSVLRRHSQRAGNRFFCFH